MPFKMKCKAIAAFCRIAVVIVVSTAIFVASNKALKNSE